MHQHEQEQRAPGQPHIPIRRRGREPPKPTPVLDNEGAGDGGGESRGWQLHHSSSGLLFYLCVTHRARMRSYVCGVVYAAYMCLMCTNDKPQSRVDTGSTMVYRTTHLHAHIYGE